MHPERSQSSVAFSHAGPADRAWQAHVDGLRALAIIPVLLYHLFPRLCPGGFAGVDVFFVISGYLITGSIVADFDKRRFSLIDFYTRRVKRILPAYYALIAFVLVASVFTFPVTRAQSISTTALYSLAYSTNIYFWKVINYFDLSAQENPLLHLWSLGVEEQFYFVVPLLIWGICFVKRRILVASLIVLALASLTSSQVAISAGRSTFAFYMLPSRAWELLLGALLSQCPKVPAERQIRSEILAWSGLALVMISYLVLTPEMPFPGVTAIPTVLGTSLLVRYGQFGILSRVLSSSPLVGIGKISYSLYLWHWPLFVILVPYYSPKRIALCFVATCVSAWLSWRFIENPARRAKSFGPKFALATVVGCSALLAGLCFEINTVPARNGTIPLTWGGQETWAVWETRHDKRRSTCRLEELQAGSPHLLLPIGSLSKPPEFVLWGDSHALALLPGVSIVAGENGRAGFFINLKHNFTLKTEIGTEPYDPEQDREPVLRWLEERPEIQEVLLVSSWFFQLRNPQDADETVKLCQRLKSSGKRVYVFSTVPLANKQALQKFDWGLRVDERTNSSTAEAYEKTALRQDALLARIQNLRLGDVVPLHRALWNGESYATGNEGQSFYCDEGHLNEFGAVHAMKSVAGTIWRREIPGPLDTDTAPQQTRLDRKSALDDVQK